jgi:outer membrane protein insertion porin family
MKKLFPVLLLLSTLVVPARAQFRVGLGSQSPTAVSAPETQQFNYQDPKEYVIREITTSGTRFYDANSLVSISGLKTGDKIRIPGDAIPSAIKRLMEQGILEEVEITATKVEGEAIWLDVFMKERPRLYRVSFQGIKKGEQETLNDKVKLIKGKIINEQLMKNAQNTVKKFYVDKGFLNVKVQARQVMGDSARGNNASLVLNIDKGERVKINELRIEGRDALKNSVVRRKLKGTKQKKFGRLFTPSKYIPKKFEEDKEKLIAFYNKKGYRDARITSDTVYANDGETVNVVLRIEEGRQYFYRNISFEGNYIRPDSVLSEVLGIKKGDVYNPEEMQKKLFGTPQQDLSSLYMDAGYLYFSATPEEVAVEGDSIDVVIRLFEGKQATINKIILNGNDKTSDHVVLREIRTLPGQKFSKTAIIRTQQELSRLGYFDPEKIGINPVPHADGTVDIEYTVEEKPSDQIELSGGWGGYIGFVGTLGVVFNNFSARNITNLKAWKPLPAGDGQKLAVRFQASGRQFQQYSFSFTEPWLGGRKPNSLTVSLSRQVYRPGQNQINQLYGGNFGYDPNSKFNTTTIAVGLGKRLKKPDDNFSLNSSLSFQLYEVEKYPFFIPDLSDGTFRDISLVTTISRYSIDNQQYPRYGSTLSLTGTLSPPYSLFRGKDWRPTSTQDQFKWIEYHKWMFDGAWYVPLTGKLVFHTRAHMGFLGNYRSDLGISPFGRFILGGSGLSGQGQFATFGQEIIGLRGYDDRGVGPIARNDGQAQQGGVVYSKYVMELRYPISLNPSATVFVLGFLEGGNNWGSYKQFNPFDIKRAGGIGARIFMPAFGMIGIDYGIPFDGNTSNQGYKPPFKGQFHFTIGQQIR